MLGDVASARLISVSLRYLTKEPICVSSRREFYLWVEATGMYVSVVHGKCPMKEGYVASMKALILFDA